MHGEALKTNPSMQMHTDQMGSIGRHDIQLSHLPPYLRMSPELHLSPDGDHMPHSTPPFLRRQARLFANLSLEAVTSHHHSTSRMKESASRREPETSLETKPALISLFCGPGGLDEGFRQAGFVTGLAYDIEQHCVDTTGANHPGTRAIRRDIAELEVAEIIREWGKLPFQRPVGLIGGPPCQSFSRSNVHKREDDPRSELPRHYARVLKGLNDAYGLDFFVFENVPGLLDENHLPVYEAFKEQAGSAGYIVAEQFLEAKDFGVPQQRQRIIVVGLNKAHYGEPFRFPDPEVDHVSTVQDAIGHLPEATHFRHGITPDEIEFHPNHWCMRPKSKKFTDGTFKPGQIKGRCFRTLAWDQPSYTVAYGNREVHIHPECHRRLSVYEAMLLQGFPPEYVFKGTLSDQFSMVSDAVAPPVARAVAECLWERVEQQEEQAQLSLALTSAA